MFGQSSTNTFAERRFPWGELWTLWTWVQRGNASLRSKQTVTDFINSIEVLEVDLSIALEYGKLRATLLDAGTPMPDMDALIAATAIDFNLFDFFKTSFSDPRRR